MPAFPAAEQALSSAQIKPELTLKPDHPMGADHSHGRYVTFRMAEVAVSRQMLSDILSLIARLAPPAPA